MMSGFDTYLDGDEPLDAARMLGLIEDQQRSLAGRVGAFVPVSLLVWGIVWLGGFGVLWLAHADDAPLRVPIGVAAPVAVGLFLAAGIVSTVLGIRAGRGRRGGGRDKALGGIVYGQMWWIGFVGIFVIGQALVAQGMDRAALDLLYPSMYMFFVGVMFVMAALIWSATPMLALGGVAIVLGVVAPFTGPGTQYLVYALGGGIALLLAALWTQVWASRARQRIRVGGSA